jgi:hypothetical protein
MQSTPVTCRLLDTLPALQLPSWHRAGAVAQAVWNHVHSYPANYRLKGLRRRVFDPGDLTLDGEQAVKAKGSRSR